MSWKYGIAILIMLVSMTACAIPATSVPADRSLESRPAEPSATVTTEVQPSASSQMGQQSAMRKQPVTAPQALAAGDRDTLRDMAVADLTGRLKLASGDVVVQSITTRQFSDASLGLAKPGQMYAQVITPGYVIVLQAGGVTHSYHAAGSRVVYAGLASDQNKLPAVSSTTVPASAAQVTLYLGHTIKGDHDCTLVFPVEREALEPPTAELALRQLLAGPSEPELAAGYTSPFAAVTQDALISLQIEGDTAYLDLHDIRDLVQLPDACARLQFQQQILRSVQEYSPVDRVILALEGDPQAMYTWLKLPCDSSNNDCDAAPFSPTRIPLQEAVPTIPPEPATVLDLEDAIPDEAEIVRQTSLDMDADGADEVIALVGLRDQSEGMDYDWLKLLVVQTGREPQVLWQMRTLGTRAEALELRDVTGNGRQEALSLQSVGASGQTLYIMTWRNGSYGLLRPQGGYFAGWDSFGELGVGFEDVDGDGVQEIVAAYGPAASKLDIYAWDGLDYVYQTTRDYSGS